MNKKESLQDGYLQEQLPQNQLTQENGLDLAENAYCLCQECIEDVFWNEEIWDKMDKLMTKKAKERYERLRKSINTDGISKN